MCRIGRPAPVGRPPVPTKWTCTKHHPIDIIIILSSPLWVKEKGSTKAAANLQKKPPKDWWFYPSRILHNTQNRKSVSYRMTAYAGFIGVFPARKPAKPSKKPRFPQGTLLSAALAAPPCRWRYTKKSGRRPGGMPPTRTSPACRGRAAEQDSARYPLFLYFIIHYMHSSRRSSASGLLSASSIARAAAAAANALFV